jgi:signal transduction histidine kinase
MNGNQSGGGSIPKALLQLAVKLKGDVGRELRQISQKLEAEITQQQISQQRLVDGCFGLAAIGQMTSGLLSLLPDELDNLLAELNRVRHGMNGKTNGSGRDSVDRFGQVLTSMTDRLRLVQAATGGKDRRRAIDVTAEVESYEDYIEPLLDRHGIRLEVEYPSDEVLRTEMRPETLHSLLNILTANSLDWLVQVRDRKIRIGLTADESRCYVLFSDSGPGIPWQISSRIFEPLFSMKEGGRGMGLTVAKRLVESHGGLMYLVMDGRRKGTNFQILLPRKRSRATFYNGR